MRTKVTLILVFLNVALFFFIFYVRPHWVTVDQLREARARLLPSSALDIQAIDIDAGESHTRLVKRGEVWHIESPIDWPANPHAVSTILTELQVAEHKSAFDVATLPKNKMSLADYGLEKPVLSVTLTPRAPKGDGQAPERLTLGIGNPTNVGNLLYVLSPDKQRIHVVDRRLADSLNIPLEKLRAENIFSFHDYEVRFLRIHVLATNQRVEVNREGSRWAMATPVNARANKAAVAQTIALLSSLTVSDFMAQPPSPELDPTNTSLFRITLGGGNRSETLLIGEPLPATAPDSAQERYLAKIDGKNSLFTLKVPSAVMDNLRSAQVHLRETRIFEFEPGQVSSLLLKAPNRDPLTLQRLESDNPERAAAWQIVRRSGDNTPVTQAADAAAVQHLLEILSRFSVQRFLTDAPTEANKEAWGFNSPEREIVIDAAADQTGQRQASAQAAPTGHNLQTLQIGVSAERGPKAYARLDSAPYVYEVDSEILRETGMDALSWRDRNLRVLPAGARIASLKLLDLVSQKTILDSQARGKADEDLIPANLAPDKAKAWAALLTQLRALRAKSFLAERFSDTFAVSGEPRTWRYRLELGIELSGGAAPQGSTQILLLSERLGGTTQVAGAQDLDSLFLIEQPLMDALWTLTQDSQLPPPPTSEQGP